MRRMSFTQEAEEQGFTLRIDLPVTFWLCHALSPKVVPILASFLRTIKRFLECHTIVILRRRLFRGRSLLHDSSCKSLYSKAAGSAPATGPTHSPVKKRPWTPIITFSDPNDILSYPIPSDYSNQYIDSRLCPEVVNVDINVAHVSSLFGITDFADPLQAHSGCMEDDRVVKLIANGLRRNNMDSTISKRCNWTEVKRWVFSDDILRASRTEKPENSGQRRKQKTVSHVGLE